MRCHFGIVLFTVILSKDRQITIYKASLGLFLGGFSGDVGLNVRILTFQLHVKDLNKTIQYMYKHKMYQKVTSALGAACGEEYKEGSRRTACRIP